MHCQHKPHENNRPWQRQGTDLAAIYPVIITHTTCVNITVSPVLSLKRVIDLRVSYMYRRRAVRERSQSFFAM